MAIDPASQLYFESSGPEGARSIVFLHGGGVMVDLGLKSTLAKEHNWAITAPDFFAAAVRAWVSGQPLPAELKPLQL